MAAAPERVRRRPEPGDVERLDGSGPNGAVLGLPWIGRGGRLDRERLGAWWASVRFPVLFYLATRLALIVMAVIEGHVRGHPFTHELSNWDGLWYRELANKGYPHAIHVPLHPQTTLGFLPGFPLVIWPLAHLLLALGALSGNVPTAMSLAGIMISGAGGLVATVLIDRLTTGWWGPSTGRRAMILFCLFPGSVVFSMVYSEGLMIPLAIACILALQQRRWVPAGILAALATTMEPDAYVLIVVCAVSALLEVRRRGWSFTKARASLLAPLLSIAGVAALGAFFWAWTGTPLASLNAQHHGWHEKTDPLALVHTAQRLGHQISFSHFDHPPIDMNLVIGLAGAILLVLLWVLLYKSRHTVSIEALVWTLGITFLMVTSEYVPPNPRLLFTAFPAVLVLARYVKGRGFWVLAVTNGALLMALSWWTFVGWGLRP